jgi:hypothetical protein
MSSWAGNNYGRKKFCGGELKVLTGNCEFVFRVCQSFSSSTAKLLPGIQQIATTI